jgi:SAM-dependent methyltransferase
MPFIGYRERMPEIYVTGSRRGEGGSRFRTSVRGMRREQLTGHPDQVRWNAKYAEDPPAPRPHRLARQALAVDLPDGPVADLACGPSGSALLAARAGRQVTAVDISEVALDLLARAAHREGVAGRITLVHADLHAWLPEPGRYALVLCTGYWDRAVFGPAMRAVAAGGLLGWEAYTIEARARKPSLHPEWCLNPGEPASLLAPDFAVIEQRDRPDREHGEGHGAGGAFQSGATQSGATQSGAARRSLLAWRPG